MLIVAIVGAVVVFLVVIISAIDVIAIVESDITGSFSVTDVIGEAAS